MYIFQLSQLSCEKFWIVHTLSQVSSHRAKRGSVDTTVCVSGRQNRIIISKSCQHHQWHNLVITVSVQSLQYNMETQAFLQIDIQHHKFGVSAQGSG